MKLITIASIGLFCLTYLVKSSAVQKVDKQSSLQSNALCSICEAGVKYLDAQLQTPKVEVEARQELQKVCNLIDDDMEKGLCNYYISAGFGTYWLIIVDIFADAPKVCAAAHLCGSEESNKISVELQFTDDANKKCEVCKQITEYVSENSFSQNLERNLIQSISSFCAGIPNQEKSRLCQAIMVEKNGPKLYEQILSFLHSSTLCKTISMCPKSSSSSSTSACTFCMNEVNQLADKLQTPQVEGAIINVMLYFCEFETDPQQRDGCKTSINGGFSSYFLTFANILSDSKKLCTIIGLCNGQTNSSNPAFLSDLIKSVCNARVFESKELENVELKNFLLRLKRFCEK